MKNVNIELGVSFFVDIDKEGALGIESDDKNSVRYGRLTRDMM